LAGEALVEHEWMFWMMHLGESLRDPVLKFRREKSEVIHLAGMATDVHIGCHDGIVNLRRDVATDCASHEMPPEWWYALKCVNDGSLEEVCVFDKPVFYASSVMADRLIEGTLRTKTGAAASFALKPPKARGTRGRSPLTPHEIETRFKLFDNWRRARTARIPLKDFAKGQTLAGKPMTHDTVKRWLNWCSRNQGSRPWRSG
ncbi:MAG: hypothetical protein NTW19_01660, partial [Planctomycetota bacterium]|nr:hypothetical protein [Planctomycetota bacterium]